jgi:hypothetical protein
MRHRQQDRLPPHRRRHVQRGDDARVSQYAHHYCGARSSEQSDCDEVWIRADKKRLRETERVLGLASPRRQPDLMP